MTHSPHRLWGLVVEWQWVLLIKSRRASHSYSSLHYSLARQRNEPRVHQELHSSRGWSRRPRFIRPANRRRFSAFQTINQVRNELQTGNCHNLGKIATCNSQSLTWQPNFKVKNSLLQKIIPTFLTSTSRKKTKHTCNRLKIKAKIRLALDIKEWQRILLPSAGDFELEGDRQRWLGDPGRRPENGFVDC